MDRRIDAKTAERLHIALLTQAAFDRAAAFQFAQLSGLAAELVVPVLSREPGNVRQQPSFFVPAQDRRMTAR